MDSLGPLDFDDVFAYPTFDSKSVVGDDLMPTIPSSSSLMKGLSFGSSDPSTDDVTQYRISDLSLAFPLKTSSSSSLSSSMGGGDPSLWGVALSVPPSLTAPVVSSCGERNVKSESISPSPRGTPSPPPMSQQRGTRKRKRASESASVSSSSSCGSQHNVDGHLKARKDDIPEDEIKRLLMLKPSQLTEEERKIRQRAKNRQSAAVAREKRRKKQQAHDNRLQTLRNKNADLEARLAALEAENAALRKCLQAPSSTPFFDHPSERPLKRQHALA